MESEFKLREDEGVCGERRRRCVFVCGKRGRPRGGDLKFSSSLLEMWLKRIKSVFKFRNTDLSRNKKVSYFVLLNEELY